MKINKHFIFGLICCLLISGTYARVYITRNATIRFFSQAPLENIEAINQQVSCALDTETGEFVFRVLIRSFTFDKALMQEHFNDNFMHSHQYPNAMFEGKVEQVDNIDFDKNGTHQVVVTGNLTIKDVTREIRETGTLIINGNQIRAQSTFIVEPEAYNINIPSRFAHNIAREIEVSVDALLGPRD
jgi:polyisoprenoid-binding protein YceI